jgi:hypothetical protein
MNVCVTGRLVVLAAMALLLVACGRDAGEAGAPSGDPASNPAPAAAGDGVSKAGPAGGVTGGKAAAGAFPDRTGELVNPDDTTMVFLYYDLAGIAPPIDAWVEEDSRVRFAQPIDKAGKREEVRAEMASGAASVRGIGLVRLSMNANLSDYDPTYGEFTVRALAPSSTVEFKALGQKVSVKFANGRTAQIWAVPQDQAQAIRDKIGYGHQASLDVLLRITGVQPGPGGGTLTTEVVEYEMRNNRTGQVIGRVRAN